MSNKISVLLVDDHALVRRGFRRMLEDEPEIDGGWRSWRRRRGGSTGARNSSPSVIVMDCALPGISGIEATRQILRTSRRSGDSDAQHAFGRNAGSRRRSKPAPRIHSEERDGSGIAGRDSGVAAGKNGSRSAGVETELLKGERESRTHYPRTRDSAANCRWKVEQGNR